MNQSHVFRGKPKQGCDAIFYLVPQRCRVARVQLSLARNTRSFGLVVCSNEVGDELLDCSTISVVRRWYREVLNKLLAMGVVAPSE